MSQPFGVESRSQTRRRQISRRQVEKEQPFGVGQRVRHTVWDFENQYPHPDDPEMIVTPVKYEWGEVVRLTTDMGVAALVVKLDDGQEITDWTVKFVEV